MDILAYNPGHDGAVAQLRDGVLVSSVEAEKDSNWRYTPLGASDVLDALTRLDAIPDVVAAGGWWPREAQPTGPVRHVGYRGVMTADTSVRSGHLIGKPVTLFSSSHERSHILGAFGMSPFPMGSACYALVWEGAIGAFYEIDERTNVRLVGDVMNGPGNRYASLYGLADPTFPKNAPFSRLSDAGKLMALASFSKRDVTTAEEEELLTFLLDAEHVQLDMYDKLTSSTYYNVGTSDQEFRNFAGILDDRIFGRFRDFAEANLRRNVPLVVSGGCGLNCDWNSKWLQTGLFSDVFVPPVANDSGSAIGTAVDAQLHFTGDAKVKWNVYCGLPFDIGGGENLDGFDVRSVTNDEVAAMLEARLILGWVNGNFEMGPRALGNRSILAAPFDRETSGRLNAIKLREDFRPIAPAALVEDASRWFGCDRPSPFMLYTFEVLTDRLAAVTHVNGTARLQTVDETSNQALHDLLVAFRARTGFGVLCNTSLNFSGKGFINNLADLVNYASSRDLDGFVIDGRAYLNRASIGYQTYRKAST